MNASEARAAAKAKAAMLNAINELRAACRTYGTSRGLRFPRTRLATNYVAALEIWAAADAALAYATTNQEAQQ